MTFVGCSWEVDQVSVFDNSIEIVNASDLIVGDTTYNMGNPINHSEVNTNYNCAEIGIKFGGNAFPSTTNEICTNVLGGFSSMGPFLKTILAIFSVLILLAILLVGILAIQSGIINDSIDMKTIITFMTGFFGLVVLLVVGTIVISGVCSAG